MYTSIIAVLQELFSIREWLLHINWSFTTRLVRTTLAPCSILPSPSTAHPRAHLPAAYGRNPVALIDGRHIGLGNLANGFWMLLAPENWFQNLPAAVPDTGPSQNGGRVELRAT